MLRSPFAGLPARNIVVAVAGAALLAGVVALGPNLADLWANTTEQGECHAGRPVTFNGEGGFTLSPRIWQDWVVWHESSQLGEEADVYAYHIPSGEVRALATGPAMQTVAEIYKDTVVWREQTFDPAAVTLQVHNLSTGETQTLPIPIESDLAPRGIHQDWILIDGADEQGAGLFAYNRATREFRKVTSYPVGVSEIWDGKITWVQQNNESPTGHDRLMLHNLSSNKTTVLLHDEEDWTLSDPDIYRDLVVFMRGSTSTQAGPVGDWDIGGLWTDRADLWPVAENTTGPSIQQEPRVAGDWVVYLAGPYGHPSNMMGYHVPTGETVTVAADTNVGHDVWRDRVVFRAIGEENERPIGLICLEAPLPDSTQPNSPVNPER